MANKKIKEAQELVSDIKLISKVQVPKPKILTLNQCSPYYSTFKTINYKSWILDISTQFTPCTCPICHDPMRLFVFFR